MNRRELLFRGGCIGVATLLGGCTEENLAEAEREPAFVDEPLNEEEVPLPVEQKLDIGADGIREADGVGIPDVDALGGFLEDRVLAVESMDVTAEESAGEEVSPEVEVVEHDPVVALEYVPGDGMVRGTVHSLGIVAGGYARLVEAGDDSGKLRATRLGPDGTAFGEYEVRRSWAEEYNSGALTPREYAAEVLESTKSI